MQNEMIFNNGKIDLPIKEVNGELFFDAEQTAIGLGICLEKKGTAYVRWERVRKYLNSPQVEKGDYISEPDFYTLAIKANSKVAQKFQYWVTHEVLPKIRKTGSYSIQKPDSYMIADPVERAKRWIEEEEKRLALADELEQAKPAIEFYNDFASLQGAISIKKFSGVLISKGLWNGSPNDLYADFRNRGFTLTAPGQWNNPSTEYIRKVEKNNLNDLQNLLDRARKQAKALESTLDEINNFQIRKENKKSEFNENPDHKKRN